MPQLATLTAPRAGFHARAARSTEPAPPLAFAGQAVTFGKDQEIFGESEPALHVYRVISGAVRSFRLLSDGRRQIADFFLPGDVFGVEAGPLRHSSAEALAETVVAVAPRHRLEGDDEAATTRALWRLAIADLQRSHEHVLTLGRRTAAERVASFLADIADRLGGGREITLPMTRQDMADYLGLTIETVSRTLTQLQGDGVIRICACKQIHILDTDALEELCD